MSYTQGGSFVFGKLNSYFLSQGGIGHQHELYQKSRSWRNCYQVFLFRQGLVLAFYKPIYYKILYPTAVNEYIIKEEKFNIINCICLRIFTAKPHFQKDWMKLKLYPAYMQKEDLILSTAKRIRLFMPLRSEHR